MMINVEVNHSHSNCYLVGKSDHPIIRQIGSAKSVNLRLLVTNAFCSDLEKRKPLKGKLILTSVSNAPN